jgi:hypothetical protein
MVVARPAHAAIAETTQGRPAAHWIAAQPIPA